MLSVKKYSFLVVTFWLLSCETTAVHENHEPRRQTTKTLPVATQTTFKVENWYGTWTGTRPEYPLRNSSGEIVVIRGQEAKVGSSTFEFTIGATGTAELVQSHDDGRVATFSGTWKGRMETSTNTLTAVVCDLTANSTGAYRQYALMVDESRKTVVCHGTSVEPPFDVTFSTR